MTEEGDRHELIKYIKDNDFFYFGVNFSGHSLEQLLTIKIEIERKKELYPLLKLNNKEKHSK